MRREAIRDVAIPLYHQIFLTLRDEILSGERPFGAVLPTENQLAEIYSVSRITARRAMDELAGQGLVERRQRTGTKVVFKSAAKPIEGNLDHAVESLIAFGRGTRVRVVELDEVPAPEQIAAELEIEPGAPTRRALRVRSASDTHLGVIESYVPSALGVSVDRASLTRTPILELLRDAGLAIGGGTQIISAISADPMLAALLEIEPRSPILRIDRVVKTPDGMPILYTSARYRGDRYRLSVDLTGVSGPQLPRSNAA